MTTIIATLLSVRDQEGTEVARITLHATDALKARSILWDPETRAVFAVDPMKLTLHALIQQGLDLGQDYNTFTVQAAPVDQLEDDAEPDGDEE